MCSRLPYNPNVHIANSHKDTICKSLVPIDLYIPSFISSNTLIGHLNECNISVWTEVAPRFSRIRDRLEHRIFRDIYKQASYRFLYQLKSPVLESAWYTYLNIKGNDYYYKIIAVPFQDGYCIDLEFKIDNEWNQKQIRQENSNLISATKKIKDKITFCQRKQEFYKIAMLLGCTDLNNIPQDIMVLATIIYHLKAIPQEWLCRSMNKTLLPFGYQVVPKVDDALKNVKDKAIYLFIERVLYGKNRRGLEYV